MPSGFVGDDVAPGASRPSPESNDPVIAVAATTSRGKQREQLVGHYSSATWQAVIRSRNLGRNLYGLEYSRSVLDAYALIREQDGHVHSILVARGRDSARCARGEPQHAGVAR